MKKSFQYSLFNCGVVLILILLTSTFCLGQTTPVIGLHENTPDVVAFENARIVIAPGKVLENATLLIRDGHIEAVGINVTVPPDAVIQKATGKTIYPGFIDLFTNYGIPATKKQGAQSGVANINKEKKVSGAKHWNAAVQPERKAAALLKKKDDFLIKVRTAVKRGLPANKALKALTITPAAG